jgi:hypothetical protein
VALVVPLLLLGCADEAIPADPAPGTTAADGSTAPTEPPDARAQLAALAAAAQDRHISARYTLSVPGRVERTVSVTSAPDRTWRVDIPGGALGGTADVSVAQTADGLFQCSLPSPARPDPADCVRVGGPDQRLRSGIDPRVQHPFTDWQRVLTDRQAALSVAVSPTLPGVSGTCFAVESTSASLSPPLDIGIYCYDTDGTITGARLAYGTLILTVAPTAPPATVTLPGPVVDREPLRMAAPPREDRSISPAVPPAQ